MFICLSARRFFRRELATATTIIDVRTIAHVALTAQVFGMEIFVLHCRGTCLFAALLAICAVHMCTLGSYLLYRPVRLYVLIPVV